MLLSLSLCLRRETAGIDDTFKLFPLRVEGYVFINGHKKS